jgi:hypothetical protein
MISAFVSVINGASIEIGEPSTPAFVARAAVRPNDSMNAGRQSG